MQEKEGKCVKCGYCCSDLEIKVMDLVFPETFMNESGLEFYKTHGLDKILKENGKVKILHRCQHLTGRNECDLEGGKKPELCREWTCKRHLQDSQWLKDRIGELAFEKMEEIIDVFQRNGFGLREDTIRELRTIIIEFNNMRIELGGVSNG